MNKNNEWEIILRYLSGEVSNEEKKEIEKWIESSPDAKTLFDQIKEIWECSLKAEGTDTDEEWKKLSGKIKQSKTEKENEIPGLLQKIGTHLSNLKEKYYQLPFYGAIQFAVFAVLIVCIVLLYNNTRVSNRKINDIKNEYAVNIKEYYAKKGKTLCVLLSDGTKVTLNSGSRLKVYDFDNTRERRTELSGEAYFEVYKNPSKPFIVNAEGARIQVLGTKFNVTTWKQSNKITLAVEEGKVAFGQSKTFIENNVIVTKGKVSEITGNKKPVEPFNANIKGAYLSWIKGGLSFNNALLSEVIERLNNKFNADIKVKDQKMLLRHYTASFKNETLEEILKTISITLDLSYTVQSQNRVIFSYR